MREEVLDAADTERAALRPLRWASLLAANAAAFHGSLRAHLSRALGVSLRQVGRTWQQRRAALEGAHLDVAFACAGLLSRRAGASLVPLAAIVPEDERDAVFRSLLVTPARSRFASVAELEAARLAVNDMESLSGWDAPRARFAAEARPRFARLVLTGSHQRSLAALLAGRADVAAIDAMVLAAERRRRPELSTELRVLERSGPLPSPAIAAVRALPAATRDAIRQALLTLHETQPGRDLLAAGGVSRFEPAGAAHLAAARALRQRARGVRLSSTSAAIEAAPSSQDALP